MSSLLPHFENPPLTEVALSLQFETLEGLRTPQIGLVWAQFRDRFPLTEEHTPLDAIVERFGVPRAGTAEMRLQMLESPPVPRVWFLQPGGAELIQVQPDRFVHNWRKLGGTEHYPRYPRIREAFFAELQKFQAILESERIGPIVPTQCEVTYVNSIVAGEGWHSHSELGKVLTVFSAASSDTALAELEDAKVSLRFVLRNERQEPVGRLHISAVPAYAPIDLAPQIVLTLTARARPAGETLGDVLACLDLGRSAIVRAFASITTPEMHRIWRRNDV
ncbi:MAG: TIGR04255 family protein [Planctomycetaceae bacterium]|nr:MAG: TIGR04255 family protein [Planctomycetaceae bacterium]